MLPSLAKHPTTAHIISKYGGTERLQQLILADFFKHGFDGSGSDGGSCIDGRLTSAWNWCSKIEKKVPPLALYLCCAQGSSAGSLPSRPGLPRPRLPCSNPPVPAKQMAWREQQASSALLDVMRMPVSCV